MGLFLFETVNVILNNLFLQVWIEALQNLVLQLILVWEQCLVRAQLQEGK